MYNLNTGFKLGQQDIVTNFEGDCQHAHTIAAYWPMSNSSSLLSSQTSIFKQIYLRANGPVTAEQHTAECWVWSLSKITFSHISIWYVDDKTKDFKHTWDLEEWREDKFYTVSGHIKKFKKIQDYIIKKVPVPVIKMHSYCFEWSN